MIVPHIEPTATTEVQDPHEENFHEAVFVYTLHPSLGDKKCQSRNTATPLSLVDDFRLNEQGNVGL